MRTFLFVLSALVTGCGQSYCEKTANEMENCEDDYVATDEEIDECEAQMEPCSSSDESKLNAYSDCLADEGSGFCPEDFGDTTPTGTDLPAWMDAILVCAGELDGLSEECMTIAGVTTG